MMAIKCHCWRVIFAWSSTLQAVHLRPRRLSKAWLTSTFSAELTCVSSRHYALCVRLCTVPEINDCDGWTCTRRGQAGLPAPMDFSSHVLYESNHGSYFDCRIDRTWTSETQPGITIHAPTIQGKPCPFNLHVVKCPCAQS